MSMSGLQESLARILKQPLVLENRGGAGGTISMAEVARTGRFDNGRCKLVRMA